MSSWSWLPAENLQLIFQYSEVFDVQKCLLVCSNWSYEADYYLKDKVNFVLGYVRNIEDLKFNRRRFNSIVINSMIEEEIKATIEAVKQNPNILEARIIYDDIRTLSKVLKILGNKVESLTLENFETMLIDCQDFGRFPSVQNLVIENCQGSFKNIISQAFSNLRYLKVCVFEDEDETPDFMQCFSGNYSLETLILENEDSDEKLLPVLTQFKKLKVLKIGYLDEDKDFEEIANNFKQLDSLEIVDFFEEIKEKIVKQLFMHPNVTRFTIKYSLIGDGDKYWKEVFLNMFNPNVTHFELRDKHIGEPALRACMNAFPNITSFALESEASFNANFFLEMSKKWKNLDSLNLEVRIQSYISGKIVCHFPELTTLILYNVEMVLFFNFFKAENLAFLCLDVVNILDVTLESICSNFPKLEILFILGRTIDSTVFGTVETEDHIMYDENYILESIFNIKNERLKIILGRKNMFKKSARLEEFCQQSGAIVEYQGDFVRRILIHSKEIFWRIKRKY